MELHNMYDRMPTSLKEKQYGCSCALGKYETKHLEELGVSEAWYWYFRGAYDGNGAIICLKDDVYTIDSLSHCSCYGPTEDILFFDGFTVDELKEKLKKDPDPEYDFLIEHVLSIL